VTATGGRPDAEIYFLQRPLMWTLLPKERYGNSLSGRWSNNQPSNWESVTLLLSYRQRAGTWVHYGKGRATGEQVPLH